MTDSRSRCVVEISTDSLSHARPTIDWLSTDYRPNLDRLSTAISTDRSVDTTYSKHDQRWIQGHFSMAPAKSCAVIKRKLWLALLTASNFRSFWVATPFRPETWKYHKLWQTLYSVQVCGETTKRKNYFFSDSGKALQLKRIILWVCEIEVSDSDELPQFCCRSCHDKVLRLNKNLELFASTCQSTQKELERELKTSRQENMKKRSRMGNSTQSTEKPRKIPHSMVTSARKGLPFGNQ